MSKPAALDTNVLVYLHQLEDNGKHQKALELMADIPVVSTQVISEYLNVLRRILKLPKTELIGEATAWLKVCQIKAINLGTLEYAHRLINRYDFQLFDAIIVASALEANCTILYSEDMHHDLLVEKQLRILNPFV